MKRKTHAVYLDHSYSFKISRLMKLTCAFMLLCCLHVSASGNTQDKITLNLESADLKKVLTEIQRKTTYRFLYSQALVNNKKVDVHVFDAEVPAVLNTILDGAGIGYQILENKLVVLKASLNGKIEVKEVRVSGKVTGQNGEALAGVSVTVKGTAIGTATDANGNYTINAPDGNATLVFSYVGYGSHEEAIGGRTTINVSLVSSASELNTIVVVGYGTQRKRDVTGSVASVKGAEIAKQQVQNPAQAIQGRVAGVQVIGSGEPNTNPALRIRGTGTFLSGVSPLYVVDGILTDDIRNINSADIVSMEILKDASAAAIYGMRAANGVLIITTKKGRAGKVQFDYNGNAGVREITHLVDMAGPNQYAGYLNEASRFYGTGDNLIDTTLLDGTQTDWFSDITRKAFYQNHNLSMSGGSDKITYFFSVGFLDEQGVLITNKFNRFTLRSNNEYRITNNLRLSALLSYSRSDLKRVDAVGAFNSAYRAAPYIPSKRGNLYGNTSAAGNVGNPVLSLEQRAQPQLENRFQFSPALEFKPVDWLTLRSGFGADLVFYDQKDYNYKFLNAGPESVFITPGGNQVRNTSQLNIVNGQSIRWVWDNTATFSKRFQEHNITFLAGITTERLKSSEITGSRTDVPPNSDQWYLSSGNASTQTNGSGQDKFSRQSFISRLNYAYQNKYLLTATFRADGTSKFSKDNRWGYFPSIGLGWNINEEGFMKNQKFFDILKLRGSWGKIGNDQIISNAYLSIAAINLPYFFGQPGVQSNGIDFNQVIDKNIHWEKTNEFDVGLDFALLKSRLTGEIDYYKKKTEDVLVEKTIPVILGDDRYYTNAATIQNRGYELGLNWNDVISNDWNYNLSGNIAYNKNEVLSLNGGIPLIAANVAGKGEVINTAVGQPIGSFYVWQTNGLFQTDAEAAASGQAGARAGDLRYVDQDKNGKIDAKDRVFVGSYQPKITYGFSGGVTYKVVDLSFNTYGAAGGKIYNAKKQARGDSRDNIEASVARNRWTVNNPNTDVPHAGLSTLDNSTYFVEKGDFFRINNVTLGYTLPSSTLDRIKLRTVRIYVSAQNLATFTSYTGFTPELNPGTAAGAALNAGIEQGAYPSTRTWVLGVNIGF